MASNRCSSQTDYCRVVHKVHYFRVQTRSLDIAYRVITKKPPGTYKVIQMAFRWAFNLRGEYGGVLVIWGGRSRGGLYELF